MLRTVRRFQFGWFGDGGLGERLIQAILEGRKTVTSCPAYDPDDADIQVGEKLELTDKHGRKHAIVVVTRIEIRRFGDFDEELANKSGTTLQELHQSTFFANGRQLRADEEMRVVHFQLSVAPK